MPNASPAPGPGSWRRRSAMLIVLTVMSLVAALVVVAVNADGRELSRTTSNDGGAWVVNRELAAVAHKNRATGELSSFVRLSDSPTADVYQANGLVVVHDSSTNQLFEIDPRSATLDQAPTLLPDFAQVSVVDGGIVIHRSDPLAVWVIEDGDLALLASVADRAPTIEAAEQGHVAASPDGRVAVVDTAADQLYWVALDGTVSIPIELGFEGSAVDITIVDASAVVLSDAGEMVVVSTSGIEHVVDWMELVGDEGAQTQLQVPSARPTSAPLRPARSVAAVTERGELVEIALGSNGATVLRRAALGGTSPVAPIVHDGCVYGVVTTPPVFGALCDQLDSQVLAGAGQQLRLRLVNGWIWVNDVESGQTFSTNDDLRLETLDDWTLAVDRPVDEPDDSPRDVADNSEDADVDLIDDPDAEGRVRDSDDFELGEVNEAPVALDDVAETRVDVTTVVDVLRNDTDPNNDVISVIETELLAGEGAILITPDGGATQVIPGAGFSGQIRYRYTITDGQTDPASAIVTVTVVPAETNRPPDTTTDVVAVAPGESSTIDVLLNDNDPDGDAIVLTKISTESGRLSWDPSGQITFTPDATTEAGWIELPYEVTDTRGATSEGRVRVEIRDRGANQEPDARNDRGTTVVGRPVVIELLANDSDPDGDPLIVGSLPRLISPTGAEARTSATTDGEFVFEADEPGSYLFVYTINDSSPDGSESDTARIRVDVLPVEANDPPIAVRDDVVIPIGESRIVYVLENDGDPDGDVIAIVNWQASAGLLVDEFNDPSGHVGFEITVPPAAGPMPTMTYSISDGINGPVSAPIAIAVARQAPQDQAPLAADDVQEMRAGQTVEVFVLDNDFDPEGQSLRIVSVGGADGATVSVAPDEQSLVVVVPEDALSSFTVPYDIMDPAGNRAAAVLRVQLISRSAANRAPIGRTDIARTELGQPVVIPVLANDYDPDADSIGLDGIVAQPTRGSVVAGADGSIVYTPDPSFRGTDFFTYALIDGEDRALGEVFVGVMEKATQNLPPIANDDSFRLDTPARTPLTVLDNDRDPENDPIRVVGVSAADRGTVTLDGLIVSYTPPPSMDEPGVARFTYRIADSAGNNDEATVTIELDAYEERDDESDDLAAQAEPTPTPVAPEPTPSPEPSPEPTPTPEVRTENQPPVARDDNPPPVKAGTRLVVTVLDNDFDPDGEPGGLRVRSATGGATTDGLRVIIVVGEEARQYEYTIIDEFNAPATARINVLVTPNEAPIVTPLETATEFETPITLDLAAQVVDPEDDAVFFICCDNVRGGSTDVVTAAEGELVVRFTPETDFDGQAGFSYTADDQKGHRPSGSVAITVGAPGNRAPIVIDDSIELPQRAPITIDLGRLVTDPDDDALTYRVLQTSLDEISVSISDGQATLLAAETIDAGETGFFIYEVSDGVLTSEGRIDFEITEGENRPPVVTGTSIEIKAASGESVDLRLLTTEPDLRDSVSWELGAVGSDQISAELDGPLLTVLAKSSASGTNSQVEFIAVDTRGGRTPGVVQVAVVDTEAPRPSAEPDEPPRTRPEQSLEIDVRANDSDPLGDGLEVTEITEPSFGAADINARNNVVFVAGEGEVGIATMDYTVVDQAGREATATITINVVSAPDKPAPPGVDPSAEQVTISWVTPQLNGAILQGYRITPNIGEPREIAAQNSYVWQELDNGTDYWFTVTALSDLGESPESDDSDLARPNQTPEPPSVQSVTFEDEALLVEWEEPTNLGTRITDYEVRIGGETSGTEATGGVRFYRWDELENGESYTFEIRAKNDAGWSVFGPSSPPEHPAKAPEVPAIGVTERTQESGALAVNWSVPSSNNGDRVIEYLVRIAPDGVPVSVPGQNSISTEWSDLENGEEVQFQVAARNRAGTSDWSDPSIGVKPCGRPGAPEDVVATRGDRRAVISWDAADPNGCGVDRYWVSAVGSAQEFSTSDLSRPYTGLMNGTTYNFVVQAENEQGRSVLSDPSPDVIPAGPPIFCPTSGSIAAAPTGKGEITVNWGTAIANGDPPNSVVYEVRTGGGNWNPIGGSTTYVASPLQNNTSYTFEVRARNTVDVSSTTCGPVTARTWALPGPMIVATEYDPETSELEFRWSGGLSPDTPRTSVTLAALVDGSNFATSDPLVVNDPTLWPGTITSSILTTTQDGTYSATGQVCNAVGCVTGASQPVVVVVPKPPEQVLASEIILSGPQVFNSQGKLIGVELDIQVQPKANSEPVTTYNYVVEQRSATSVFDLTVGPWQQVAAGSAPFSAGSVPTSDLGRHAQLLGYSSFYLGYTGSPNHGQPVEWRVQVQAVNEVDEALFSDWVAFSPPVPEPQIRAEVVSREFCTEAEVPTSPPGSAQCIRLRVELYGFTANGGLGLTGTSTRVNADGSISVSGSSHSGRVNTRGGVGPNGNQYCGAGFTFSDENGNAVGPGRPVVTCVSSVGAEFQIEDGSGNDKSVWYPGVDPGPD